jgi:hypothetical protein
LPNELLGAKLDERIRFEYWLKCPKESYNSERLDEKANKIISSNCPVSNRT